jgi:hypothetical protein
MRKERAEIDVFFHGVSEQLKAGCLLLEIKFTAKNTDSHQ